MIFLERKSKPVEAPAAWLSPTQNELLAGPRATHPARGSSVPSQATIDALASWRTIEIFAALLPIGWG